MRGLFANRGWAGSILQNRQTTMANTTFSEFYNESQPGYHLLFNNYWLFSLYLMIRWLGKMQTLPRNRSIVTIAARHEHISITNHKLLSFCKKLQATTEIGKVYNISYCTLLCRTSQLLVCNFNRAVNIERKSPLGLPPIDWLEDATLRLLNNTTIPPPINMPWSDMIMVKLY